MKNCNEILNGKLGSSGACGLPAPSYTLIITYAACFVSKPHQVKSEFNSGLYEQHFFPLCPFASYRSLIHSPYNVCVHMCVSARVLKHHEGIGPLPPLLPTNVKG